MLANSNPILWSSTLPLKSPASKFVDRTSKPARSGNEWRVYSKYGPRTQGQRRTTKTIAERTSTGRSKPASRVKLQSRSAEIHRNNNSNLALRQRVQGRPHTHTVGALGSVWTGFPGAEISIMPLQP